MKKLVAVMLLALGCAVPYGRYSYWAGGGYDEKVMGDGLYLLIARHYDDPAGAYEFFHRRATELCGKYEVLDQSGGASSAAMVPVAGMWMTVQEHSVQGRIRCLLRAE